MGQDNLRLRRVVLTSLRSVANTDGMRVLRMTLIPNRLLRLAVTLSITIFMSACSRHESPSPEHIPLPPAASDVWYGAYIGGQRVGYMRQRTQPADGGGMTIYTENFISMRSLDHPISIRTIESIESTVDFKPIRYFQSLDAGVGQSYRVRGERLNDRLFTVKSTSAGRLLKEKTIDLNDITFPQLADQLIRSETLAVGKSWTFQVLNPVDFLPIRILISVDTLTILNVSGLARPVFQVTARLGSVDVVSYVDTGQIDPYRIEMPGLGLQYRMEDKSAAEKISVNAPADIDLAYFSAVIPSGGTFPAGPAGRPEDSANRVRVRLSQISPADLALHGDFQIVRSESPAGVELELRRPEGSLLGAPPADTRSLAGDSPAWSPEILRLTAQFHRASPADFSRDAIDWMQKHIRQVPTSMVPSAADVLEIKQGDCNEFSALFHALATAAGFPCKIVSGVIYMDGRYFYHSWNELLAGRTWVPVDPIMDEIPASVRHIKLVEGDFSASWKLAGVVRKLQIEILP